QRGWQLDGAGIRIGSNDDDRRRVIRMTISREGEGRLFCCCGSRVRDGGPVSIYENILAGNLAGFLSVAGTFYVEAGYNGAVDVGVAVTGLRWAHSYFLISGQHMESRSETASTRQTIDALIASSRPNFTSARTRSQRYSCATSLMPSSGCGS